MVEIGGTNINETNASELLTIYRQFLLIEGLPNSTGLSSECTLLSSETLTKLQ